MSMVLTWIFIYLVIGFVLSGFGGLLSRYEEDKPSDLFDFLRRIILVIPKIVAGVILHVGKDFKNHKLGYAALFIVVAFLGFGVVMGLLADPASPAPIDR